MSRLFGRRKPESGPYQERNGEEERNQIMAREKGPRPSPPEQVISIIGPGMKIIGDCETEGAVRVEGTVQGNINAQKAVVVGQEGTVEGDILTQDAVISGTVKGTIRAESRLEVQATSRISGEVIANRLQLEEGAVLNGTVQMGKTEGLGKGTSVPSSLPSPMPNRADTQVSKD
ncbi:polymer-forming cytoskeletal protein [Gemmatimonadota bacterium]